MILLDEHFMDIVIEFSSLNKAINLTSISLSDRHFLLSSYPFHEVL